MEGVRGLSFADGDLGAWCGPPVDVVFANASLHWVPDHPALLARLRGGLRAGGQLAFQVPANFDHPSHVIAREVATEPPFAGALAADPPPDPGQHLLAPTSYASVLYDLGARSAGRRASRCTGTSWRRPMRSSSGSSARS